MSCYPKISFSTIKGDCLQKIGRDEKGRGISFYKLMKFTLILSLAIAIGENIFRNEDSENFTKSA